MPVTVITTSTTTQIKQGWGILRQILVAAPGTSWTLQVKDSGASGTASTIMGASAATIPATADESSGVFPIQPVIFQNGLQIITAGATPGELDVHWE